MSVNERLRRAVEDAAARHEAGLGAVRLAELHPPDWRRGAQLELPIPSKSKDDKTAAT